MFGCRRFYGSHRGEAIRTSYQEILGDFEIADKVTIIVNDSASIMVKAFSLPGYVITNDLEVYEGEEDDKEDLEPLAINIEDSDDVLCHTDVIRFFSRKGVVLLTHIAIGSKRWLKRIWTIEDCYQQSIKFSSSYS